MDSGVSVSRPQLAALDLGGSTDAWRGLGFAVAGGRIAVEGVAVRFDQAQEPGLRAWALRGVPADTDLDGIPCSEPPPPAPPDRHPNGVERIDHVVVATPRLERTLAALEEAGLEVRRLRESGSPPLRQAFLPAGPALVEAVEDPRGGDGPARLWGVTFVVADVDALAAAHPDSVGRPRAAVQPGRRIVTARGLGVPVAFITPRE
jgi:hypothetical protein